MFVNVFWSDYVYLFSDEILSFIDRYLGSVICFKSLVEGVSYMSSGVFMLLFCFQGIYYVIVVIDVWNFVVELDNGNNISVSISIIMVFLVE